MRISIKSIPFCVVLCGIWITGCSAIGGNAPDPAMLQAEVTGYADEATALAQGRIDAGTSIARTSAAAATYVVVLDGINEQLAATLRAEMPPTQQVLVNSGPVTPGMNAPLPGEESNARATPDPASGITGDSGNRFADVGTALDVNASDGCTAGQVSQFTTTTPLIYVTTRILDARAGSTVYAEWRYNDAVVSTSTTITLPDDPDYCIWFYLEPSDTPFQPGNWSAQYWVNDTPVTPSASFTME